MMLKKCSCLQLAAVLIAALLILCSAAAYIAVSASHGLFIPVPDYLMSDDQPIVLANPEVASCTAADGGLMIIPLRDGSTEIICGAQFLATVECRTNGFVYDSTSGRYTGAAWVQGMMLTFLTGSVLILLLLLIRQMKTAFYHYATPLLAGFLVLNVLLLVSLLLILPSGLTLETALASLPSTSLMFTIPVMFLFVFAMLISNISLLRHEGKTWRNLLGTMIGLALSLSALVVFFNADVSGSLEELHFHDFLLNLLSGLVLWTDCKLAGIIFCGTRAARHQPAPDKDYILILGCQLSRKGGLTPLLRGRVDRALSFARQQQAATGHMPVLIPCGGKGHDEIRSEAAAMTEYLLEQGVQQEGILPEDRSANTWENIRNAQAMMKPGAKVAYSTTNYHVFRAGVWASRNGLQAEGMGSKTKWYYWPNAFMREYVALIAANWVHELIMIVLIGIQSGLLAYLYH